MERSSWLTVSGLWTLGREAKPVWKPGSVISASFSIVSILQALSHPHSGDMGSVPRVPRNHLVMSAKSPGLVDMGTTVYLNPLLFGEDTEAGEGKTCVVMVSWH